MAGLLSRWGTLTRQPIEFSCRGTAESASWTVPPNKRMQPTGRAGPALRAGAGLPDAKQRKR